MNKGYIYIDGKRIPTKKERDKLSYEILDEYNLLKSSTFNKTISSVEKHINLIKSDKKDI